MLVSTTTLLCSMPFGIIEIIMRAKLYAPHLALAPPLFEGRQELICALVLRPEVGSEIVGVLDRFDALLGGQLLDADRGRTESGNPAADGLRSPVHGFPARWNNL